MFDGVRIFEKWWELMGGWVDLSFVCMLVNILRVNENFESEEMV